MADRPLRSQYDKQRWDIDDEMLKKWQRGRTGYPLVDAAMRQVCTRVCTHLFLLACA